MSRTILSVEDDDAVQFLLQIALEKQVGGDFELLRVLSGEEGLAFLRTTGVYAHAPKPDLVLLNLDMPGISGLEVLARMREDDSLKSIPAVVFTSSDLNKDRAECLALGARDFLSKPNDFEGVVQAVKPACAYAA
jgi:CheY-like chemotaxis protein